MTEKIFCGKCNMLLYFGEEIKDAFTCVRYHLKKLFWDTIKIPARSAAISYRWKRLKLRPKGGKHVTQPPSNSRTYG